MHTIEKIERRRREIRYLNYFLMYIMAMTVFGLFFFIDEITGFVGALKYNIMLRLYFISFVVAVIFYLAQKERQQATLTKNLLSDMENTSTQLSRELRSKEFLSTISFLISQVQDTYILEKLFKVTRQFFKAEGGFVVLRDKNSKWETPLITFPETIDPRLVDRVTDFITKTGRSLIQPEPGIENHQPIKLVKNLIAVPLRLEGRLWGAIAFWTNSEIKLEKSELEVLEIIACEASNSAVTIDSLREQSDIQSGLLSLLSKVASYQTKTNGRAKRIADKAQSLATMMELTPTTVEAIEIAAILKDVHKIAGKEKKNGNGSKASAKMLKSLKFPNRITEIISMDGRSKKLPPIGARIIDVAEAYIDKAHPARGRAPAAKTILAKMEKGSFDERVMEILKKSLN